jgi:hypothetical protein
VIWQAEYEWPWLYWEAESWRAQEPDMLPPF